MKKLVVFWVVAVFFMGLAGICRAAAIGPMEPLGPMKVGVGAEYNNFGRDLSISGSVGVTSDEVRSSNQGYAVLALGITDWANVYGKLGFADLEERVNWVGGGSHTIRYNSGPLWAVGGNAKHDLGNNFGIGGDIQFDMWFGDGDSISGSNNPKLTQGGAISVYDFQTAAYLTYSYDVNADSKIIPYLGGYYSYFNIHWRKATNFEDDNGSYVSDGNTKADDHFGLLAGMNITSTENFSVKLEGRFFAETAGTLGVFYKF